MNATLRYAGAFAVVICAACAIYVIFRPAPSVDPAWDLRERQLIQERDSAVAAASKSWAHVDLLTHENDSLRAVTPTYPAIVRERIRAMEFSPLDEATDTLSTP